MPNDTKTSRLFRLLLSLLNSYPKTQEECTSFLQIQKSAFYNYINELKSFGFEVQHKEGRYWIEVTDKASPVLANLLHFSEEEACILARCLDAIDGHSRSALRLKQKLAAFLNQDKAVEAYLRKDKTKIVQILKAAKDNRKQVQLLNYASGNSQTIKNRLVEPFEFNDDYNLVYAFDTGSKENRQFKVCRIQDVQETLLDWKFGLKHRSMPVDAFRNSGLMDKQVAFEMNLRARNLLVEEYPLTEKSITSTARNRFLFEASVAKYEGPGRFVLGIADDIRLIGDNGFRVWLKEKIKNLPNIF
jgi:predicted DNA-binding transcriptional regulator YafY